MSKGDHITVSRWLGFYYHHGIDIGDGTIVHFTGEPKRKRDAAVVRTTREKFVRHGRLEVVDYSWVETAARANDDTRLRPIEEALQAESSLGSAPKLVTVRDLINRINDPDLTIKAALQHVGHTRYDLFSNNCEHFAVYCKTGIKHSDQIARMTYMMRLHSIAMRNPGFRRF